MADDENPPGDRTTFPFSNDQLSPKKEKYEFSFALPAPPIPSPQVQPMDIDTSGPIQLPAETPLERIAGEKKRKLNNGKVKRMIRKLGQENNSSSSNKASSRGGETQSMCQLRSLLICSVIGMVMATLSAVLISEDLRQDVYKGYRKQYQLLFYGVEDYCTQELNLSNVTEVLQRHLIGQERASSQIVDFVYQHRNREYSSLALVGPTGVGKTLAADLVASNWQWRLNVHRFFTHLRSGEQYPLFQHFLHSIREGRQIDFKCGHNLLIVENLGVDDVPLINRIDDRLKFVAAKEGIQLTALYVFEGAATRDEEKLAELNGSIGRVQLHTLTEEDLVRCVQREAEMLGVDLEQNPQLEHLVLASVDVHSHGCKTVKAKLSMHSFGLNQSTES